MEDNREFRVVGPPGTGKTTWLADRIKKAVAKVGSERVLVASLTRAAAAEIADRRLNIPKSRIGTVHAHAFRALDCPELAETPKGKDLWNQWCADEGKPFWQLSCSGSDIDAPADGMSGAETYGDRLINEMQINRARMIDKDVWRPEIHGFYNAWTAWKSESALFDFTDLLEVALSDISYAPGDPSAIFLDEAQDIDRLGKALMAKWAGNMRKGTFVVVGDPDQNLYMWRGTDPHAFDDPPVPDEQRRVLSQSYRVPAAVHTFATDWINRTPGRRMVDYYPRREDPKDNTSPFVQGEVRRCHATISYPEPAIALAEQYMAQGKTVMFLTACGYMLEKLKSILRKEAMPFFNPYRQKRGDWNPLHAANGTTGAERILALKRMERSVWGEHARMWSTDDFIKWAEILKSKGIFYHGKKGKLVDIKNQVEMNINEIMEYIEPDAFQAAFGSDLDWYYNNITPSRQRAMRFPIDVAKKHGARKLRDKPQIIIGTIHSVKGGQADVVFLFPDLSRAGMAQWVRPGEMRNAVIRQFYVGITRARESLVLCNNITSAAVPI